MKIKTFYFFVHYLLLIRDLEAIIHGSKQQLTFDVLTWNSLKKCFTNFCLNTIKAFMEPISSFCIQIKASRISSKFISLNNDILLFIKMLLVLPYRFGSSKQDLNHEFHLVSLNFETLVSRF